MKKLVLVLSLVLNVFLICVCVYLLSRPKARAKDVQMAHYLSLQDRMPVKEGDILFLGGERMALCNWMELMGDNRVRNRAYPGGTVKWTVRNMDQLLNSQPSKLILQFGMDDMVSGENSSSFIADYGAMVEHIREVSPQTEIFILSLIPIDEVYSKALYPNLTNEMVSAMNRQIKAMAMDKSLTFVNLYDEFLNAKTGSLNSIYTTEDGFHLNSNAYFIWKDRLVSFF